ncbi:glycosyltransferase [Streptomyces sp. NPDC085481]|uniref:glycosyltransferase n=1 Tax=Streptomyces sp. NPDC085481 TaxID=3365727 RepID=UPI0037D5B9E9
MTARPPTSITVADLDLASPDGPVLSLRPAPGGPPVAAPGAVYALVRLRGRPVATVLHRLEEDDRDPAEALRLAVRDRLTEAEGEAEAEAGAGAEAQGEAGPGPGAGAGPGAGPAAGPAVGSGAGPGAGSRPAPAPAPHADPPPAPTAPPRTTTVIATRDRAGRLVRALDSLLAQDHPDHDVLVVDNAPRTPDTRTLVQSYGGRVRYVREDTPGLATAHNTGLRHTDAPVVAFTDDDVVADPAWLSTLTAPFAADPFLGCTTGLILPARLGTPAQILLESHGGFAKGFTPRLYDPLRPPPAEPLFPFAAGSFGSGANMAFRADALRAVGGFDPATGTGTAARGGDDLYAFVAVLAAGFRLRYTPGALVWHHHRETWQDLRNQAYGYGAGLTAYLTATLVRRPGLLPALLTRLPRGLAHARAMTAPRPHTTPGTLSGHHPWPRALSRLERRGMLYGPVGYATARLSGSAPLSRLAALIRPADRMRPAPLTGALPPPPGRAR